MFEGLKKKRVITEKKKNYLKLNFEKPTNVGKLHLLLNIHKRFSNFDGIPRYFELWYPHRKRFEILRSSFAANNERRKILYIRYRWDLGEKTVGAILVTTDMVGIYPNISHIEGLEVLCKQYGKFLHKKVPTEDIIKIAENVLKKVFLSLVSSFSNKYVEPLLPLNLLPPPYDCNFYGLH